MGDGAPGAIDAAFLLAKIPTIAPWLRAMPVPADIALALRIVTGNEIEIERVCRRFSCSAETAELLIKTYLQHIILFPGADNYRILCARPETSCSDIKRNYRLLVRWLHPDMNANDWESGLLFRVTTAWEELMNGYGGHPVPSPPPGGPREKVTPTWRIRWIQHPLPLSRQQVVRFWLLRGSLLFCAAISGAGMWWAFSS